jgi:hypothetical protein
MFVVLLIICIIIIVCVVAYMCLPRLSNALIFQPQKVEWGTVDYDPNNYDYNTTCEDFVIDSSDAVSIHCIYIKNLDVPDILTIFAHGNGSNILQRITHPTVHNLLQYGSVFLFDYRGYGLSSGSPSEQGVKDDMLHVWNYVIGTKGYKADRCIVYGESLGCSIVSWLTLYLFQHNLQPPQACIMQSGFYSLKEIVSDLVSPLVTYFLVNEFDNSRYVRGIKEYDASYPIYILHSKADELIGYHHAQRLEEHGCELITILGTHNSPRFTEKVDQMFRRLV